MEVHLLEDITYYHMIHRTAQNYWSHHRVLDSFAATCLNISIFALASTSFFPFFV